MSARIGRHGRRIHSTGNLGGINLDGFYADIRDAEYFWPSHKSSFTVTSAPASNTVPNSTATS